MSGVTLSVSISRTMLGLSTLVLPGTDYGFGHIELDGVQWDRTFAQSPWVDGRALTGARMQANTLRVPLIVRQDQDAALAGLNTAVQALKDAVTQFAWTFSLAATIGVTTTAYQWACEPADISPGEVVFSRALGARIIVLACTIPVSPRPISGPL